jgi:hypothetical protein
MSETFDGPVITSIEESERRRGTSMLRLYGYQPPLDGRSDDYKGFDEYIAKGVVDILDKHYWGYRWTAKADTSQGIVAFQIPELMGPTLHVVIRLAEFRDLDEKLIMRTAGNLLERMNLPRTAVDMAAYAFARENKHTFDFDDVAKKAS